MHTPLNVYSRFYETTGDGTLLRAAEKLAERLVSDFYDEAHSARSIRVRSTTNRYCFALPKRTMVRFPNATAVAAEVLARLSDHCGRPKWREQAIELVQCARQDR